MAMCDADEDTIKATISGIGKFFLGIIILGVFVVTPTSASMSPTH
jgi:hypothetical protein